MQGACCHAFDGHIIIMVAVTSAGSAACGEERHRACHLSSNRQKAEGVCTLSRPCMRELRRS